MPPRPPHWYAIPVRVILVTFIGALIYVVLKTFALDALVSVGLDGNRFRLLIGLGFLAIVFFSPDGVLGLWARWRNRARPMGQGGGHG